MDLDPGAIMASLIVGLFGSALFIYGKKQSRLPHMVAGVVLCVFPFFVTNPLFVGLIAVAVIALCAGAVRLGA